ncbi:MAG: hypothetical protein ACXADB_07215 [Candidatus Hermodarchaeia archaeon]|jgi:hypothetical protein
MNQKYTLVRNLPVARFYYQGHHTHPVRRVIVITKQTRTSITGYELREGSVLRTGNFPVKTFRKDRIAEIGQLDKRRVLRQNTPKTKQGQTTLSRSSLASLVLDGI